MPSSIISTSWVLGAGEEDVAVDVVDDKPERAVVLLCCLIKDLEDRVVLFLAEGFVDLFWTRTDRALRDDSLACFIKSLEERRRFFTGSWTEKRTFFLILEAAGGEGDLNAEGGMGAGGGGLKNPDGAGGGTLSNR